MQSHFTYQENLISISKKVYFNLYHPKNFIPQMTFPSTTYNIITYTYLQIKGGACFCVYIVFDIL